MIGAKPSDNTSDLLDRYFVKKGAEAPPIFAPTNRMVASIPRPFSYRVLFVEIKSGYNAEYPNPVIAESKYIKYSFFIKTITETAMMAIQANTIIIFM